MLIIAWTPPALAQLTLPKALSAPPPAETAAPPADPRAQAEAQLAEARRRQAADQVEYGSGGPEGLPANHPKRLNDRLVVAYSERLKLLDELAERQKAPRQSSTQQALLGEFAGPAPYSALLVDRLRDEYDAASDSLQSLASGERALETQKAALIDAQRRAAEAVRLAEDQLARARGDQEIEVARGERKFAVRSLHLADAELANITLGLEKLRLETRSLQRLAREFTRVLTRVLPGQHLGKEQLDQQQALLTSGLAKVNAEIDRVIAENNRRAGERERLAKLAANGNQRERIQRLQLLDAKLETDRVVLMTLNWMQAMVQLASDAWAQRYLGLNAKDVATRQAVSEALSRIRGELASRKGLAQELQKAARVTVREQELRLDGALLDSEATAHESAILDALQERVLVYQRVDLMGSRLERQLERWLDDFGFQAAADSADKWRFGMLQLAQTTKRIWNFEMFAVEDSTVVDGKTVTVTYGVTVGKSIGALLLFILGYWLFSLLSRRLQRVMVGRFGVNEQLASVIRRWAMISLAVVLLVFILNLARIPLTVFAFLGGALAIGIGFGTQTIIKNVISGIIILFERKIRVGDIIAVGGMTGHVTAVDLRASTVRGFDGIEALVPNSNFLENQVVNWTYSNPRIRREIRIGIAYGSAVHTAAEIITGCAEEHGQVLKDPAPEVFFEDFGDSALLLVLVFWVELGPHLMTRRVDSDLRYAMEKRLAAAGISIPFPQRDVNLILPQGLPVRCTRVPETGA